MNPSKTRRGIDDPPFDDEVVLHPSCDASLSSRIQIHVEAEQLAAVKPSARWCSLRLEDDPFQLRPPVVHRCSNFKSLLPHQIVSKEPESLLNSNTTSTLQWIHRPKDISLFRFQQQLLLVVVHYTVSSIYYSVQYTLVH